MSNGDEGDSAAAHGEGERTWRQRLANAIAWLRARWHEQVVVWWRTHRTLLEFSAATVLGTFCGVMAHIPDSPTTPGGMLALELPGTRSGALAMLALLREGDRVAGAIGTHDVTLALLWDFVFIAAYVTALLLATEWAIRRRFSEPPGNDFPPRQLVDRFAAKAPLIAAAFDCIENASLLVLINWTKDDGVGLLASATTLAAICKWTTLVFLALYLARLLVVIWWGWVLAGRARLGEGSH